MGLFTSTAYSFRRLPPVVWPAIVATSTLLAISIYIFGSIWRPGLFGEVAVEIYLSLVVLTFQRRARRGAVLLACALVAFYAACFIKWLMLREAFNLFDVTAVRELLM